MALSRGLRLHLYLVDWLIRPQSGGSLSEHSDSGRPNQSLGWIINKKKKKSELKPTQVFFVGYEYHLDSALVKPTQERWLNFRI